MAEVVVKKKKLYLPADSMDIIRSLLRVRGDEIVALLKEEFSVKKVYPLYGIIGSSLSTKGDEIHAHLLGIKTGKMWLIRINLESKSCHISAMDTKAYFEEEEDEKPKRTRKKEKADSQSATRENEELEA